MENSDLTIMLKQAAAGDNQARELVYNSFYGEIKNLAVARMSSEKVGHTLQPTALVNEAWLKLININQIDWNDRRHFLAMAAKIMRQILIDHARAKTADKRGGENTRVSFEEDFHYGDDSQNESIIALHESLLSLSEKDERKAKIVELKYFGGYSNEEIADILGVSTPTIKRDWAMAKSWLFKELKGTQ